MARSWKSLYWLLILAIAVLVAVYISPIGFIPPWFRSLVEIPVEEKVNIDVDSLKEMMKRGSIKLIDVREPDELKEAGEIPNAVNIPLDQIEEAFRMDEVAFREKYKIEKPDISDNLVFSCRSGVRSMRALKIVQDMGYKHPLSLVGGYNAWSKAHSGAN
ncbi:unnamed protein product [Heterobilharzia americana]|nr:unnamed protein product [Heterobilharzia americana]